MGDYLETEWIYDYYDMRKRKTGEQFNNNIRQGQEQKQEFWQKCQG